MTKPTGLVIGHWSLGFGHFQTAPDARWRSIYTVFGGAQSQPTLGCPPSQRPARRGPPDVSAGGRRPWAFPISWSLIDVADRCARRLSRRPGRSVPGRPVAVRGRPAPVPQGDGGQLLRQEERPQGG